MKTTKRKICVCTGTRSEYGILRPVMREIARSRRAELQVVAGGMHLSRRYGHTVDDIIADGFEISARVPMLPRDDTPAAMAESVGRGIVGFTKAFAILDSDIVVVLGDRTEAFAAATAAALSGRVLAHIHGGDRAEAGFDDFMRHAITKLAHIHFAATKESARRIERLGERKDNIFNVGAPGLDEIRTAKLPSPAATKRRFSLPADSPLILCVQHSISTEPEKSAREMTATLKALASLALPTILIYPNSDAGGRAIIDVIQAWEKKRLPWLKTFRSLPRADYLAVMKAAYCMVGNSSSGIIEAASFSLPVINIGRRQAGRERCGNTLDVAPDTAAISRALGRLLKEKSLLRKLSAPSNVYGDGRSSSRIAKTLITVALGPGTRKKQITY